MAQSLKFGLLLSNCLEKLMLGSLDLDAQLMSRKVGNILNNASKAGCVFECHYQPPRIKGSRVIVNPIFSALIFLNIFSNSKRALEKKGMEPKVEASIRRKGNMAIFEFTDAGCGMPPEIMEKLNAGLSVTTKEESGAHGIGFQYCRELAEKMGGKLYVNESAVDVGTTVTLELKLAE
jgi:signal transduction histidine kinase